MMGAFVAYFLLQYAGVGYWWALLLAPVAVGVVGVVLERFLLKRLYALDHLYGLLLTFGLGLIIQGIFRNSFGSSGLPYAIPAQLTGGRNLGFMVLPNYRAWVIVFRSGSAWPRGSSSRHNRELLRAANANPASARLRVNVPRMITLTYGRLRAGRAGGRVARRSTGEPLWAPT